MYPAITGSCLRRSSLLSNVAPPETPPLPTIRQDGSFPTPFQSPSPHFSFFSTSSLAKSSAENILVDSTPLSRRNTGRRQTIENFPFQVMLSQSSSFSSPTFSNECEYEQNSPFSTDPTLIPSLEFTGYSNSSVGRYENTFLPVSKIRRISNTHNNANNGRGWKIIPEINGSSFYINEWAPPFSVASSNRRVHIFNVGLSTRIHRMLSLWSVWIRNPAVARCIRRSFFPSNNLASKKSAGKYLDIGNGIQIFTLVEDNSTAPNLATASHTTLVQNLQSIRSHEEEFSSLVEISQDLIRPSSSSFSSSLLTQVEKSLPYHLEHFNNNNKKKNDNLSISTCNTFCFIDTPTHTFQFISQPSSVLTYPVIPSNSVSINGYDSNENSPRFFTTRCSEAHLERTFEIVPTVHCSAMVRFALTKSITESDTPLLSSKNCRNFGSVKGSPFSPRKSLQRAILSSRLRSSTSTESVLSPSQLPDKGSTPLLRWAFAGGARGSLLSRKRKLIHGISPLASNKRQKTGESQECTSDDDDNAKPAKRSLRSTLPTHSARTLPISELVAKLKKNEAKSTEDSGNSSLPFIQQSKQIYPKKIVTKKESECIKSVSKRVDRPLNSKSNSIDAPILADGGDSHSSFDEPTFDICRKQMENIAEQLSLSVSFSSKGSVIFQEHKIVKGKGPPAARSLIFRENINSIGTEYQNRKLKRGQNKKNKIKIKNTQGKKNRPNPKTRVFVAGFDGNGKPVGYAPFNIERSFEKPIRKHKFVWIVRSKCRQFFQSK